jgi:hypothetical protein
MALQCGFASLSMVERSTNVGEMECQSPGDLIFFCSPPTAAGSPSKSSMLIVDDIGIQHLDSSDFRNSASPKQSLHT